MATWQVYKNNISSIPDDEMTIIDTLSALQSDRIEKGITQKELAAKIGMKQP